jgi:small subunit ribosomal protein S6
MLNLEADNDTLREYERIMGLNEDILRFMNISIDEIEEGQSIMMQAQRAERAPRGGERGDRESRDDARAENDDADASAQTEE